MLEDCSFIYNYLYETSRNETHSRNKISFRVICVYVMYTLPRNETSAQAIILSKQR